MTDVAMPVTTRRPQDRPRSWPDRLAQIRSEYPSTMDDRATVREALADYDLVGRIMRDILRIGWEAPTRGQRAPLEWNDGSARLRALESQRTGQATTKPFAEAFRELAAGITLDALADALAMSRSQVHRLLRDEIPATPPEIVKVAVYFDKPPTYFHEYRLHLICASIAEQLSAVPERSIDVAVRLGVHPVSDD
jgi:AraC-like DNA-binding protein